MNLRKYLSLFGIVAMGSLGLAACDSGSTDPVDEVQPPGAPSALAVAASGNAITVTFTPGPRATSHRADLIAADEGTSSQTLGATDTSVTFSDLAAGKTYTIQVFAINSAGTAASTAATATLEEGPQTIIVSDQILENTTWETGNTYVLRGPIFVGNDVGANGNKAGGQAVTLIIEPGVTVLGDEAPAGTRASYLAVARGSKIIADANANRADKSARPNPEDVIVFTSRKPRGSRAREDWGGMIINGRAPINTGAEAQGEGDTGFYGGPFPNDDSGILRGVRIEFAGDNITTDDQLNGLATQGVGAGTIIDYVQIHYNKDDGFEPFGGTHSMTHVVATGIGDDSFDGTDGYQGFIQFGIAQQRSDDADQGFEFSTGGDNDQGVPASTAVVANVTLVGAHIAQGDQEIVLGGESDYGVMLREGSSFRVFNVIATGFDGGFCIDGTQAAVNAENRVGGSTDVDSTLRFESSVLWNNHDPSEGDNNFKSCSSAYTVAQNKAFFEAAGFNNMVADPNLPSSAFSIGTQNSPPNFVPTGLPAGYSPFDVSTLNHGAGLVMPTHGATLQATTYPGAVAPGTAMADAWYYGWTVWSTGGSDSRPNDSGN